MDFQDPVVKIGKVIRDAYVFNFNPNRDGGQDPENLSESIVQLFSLLESRKISFLLVGGVALLTYIKGRNTDDSNDILSEIQKRIVRFQTNSNHIR